MGSAILVSFVSGSQTIYYDIQRHIHFDNQRGPLKDISIKKIVRYYVIKMVKVIAFSDALKEHPNLTPEWNVLTAMVRIGDKETKVVTGLENPSRGKIERVAYCKDDGTPIFDSYEIYEGPLDSSGRRKSGAIIVPYFEDRGITLIGLLRTLRPVVTDPKTGKQGMILTELPRGGGNFADASDEETAKRELGEETGKIAKHVRKIGSVNPNTAYYVTSGISVFEVEVDPTIVDLSLKDKTEPILRCEFIPNTVVGKMIADQQIICGFTLSGLALFQNAHMWQVPGVGA